MCRLIKRKKNIKGGGYLVITIALIDIVVVIVVTVAAAAIVVVVAIAGVTIKFNQFWIGLSFLNKLKAFKILYFLKISNNFIRIYYYFYTC